MLKSPARRSMYALAGATAGVASLLTPGTAHAASGQEPTATMTIIQAGAEPIVIQGTCGTVKSPEINGAKARWEVTCNAARTQVTMSGWVDDTWSDGRCAYVRGEFHSGPVELAKNCPADSPRTEFKWTHGGTDVDGYLFVS